MAHGFTEYIKDLSAYRKNLDAHLLDTNVQTNFKLKEFQCKCGGKSCNGFSTNVSSEQILKVADILQTIRDEFGRAMTINSGIRCATHNKNVGGVSSSQHLYKNGCGAADWVFGSLGGAKTVDEFMKWFKKHPQLQWSVGVYTWGIHVDNRGIRQTFNGNVTAARFNAVK